MCVWSCVCVCRDSSTHTYTHVLKLQVSWKEPWHSNKHVINFLSIEKPKSSISSSNSYEKMNAGAKGVAGGVPSIPRKPQRYQKRAEMSEEERVRHGMLMCFVDSKWISLKLPLPSPPLPLPFPSPSPQHMHLLMEREKTKRLAKGTLVVSTASFQSSTPGVSVQTCSIIHIHDIFWVGMYLTQSFQ